MTDGTAEAGGLDGSRQRSGLPGRADGSPPGPHLPLPGPLLALASVVLALMAMLALREVASLVVPLLFGLFLALIAWPLVGALERRGIRHCPALAVPILVAFGVVISTSAIVAVSISELIAQLPNYEGRLVTQIDAIQELLARYGVNLDGPAVTSLISP